MHNTSLSQIIQLSTMAGVVCHKCTCGRVCQQSWGVLFTQDDLVGMIFVTVMVPWFILSLHSPLHLHLQSVYYLIIADKIQYNIKMASNINVIVKLGSRSKVYLKSLRDLDLELVAIIAMSPPTHHKTFLSGITLKSLHVWTDDPSGGGGVAGRN